MFFSVKESHASRLEKRRKEKEEAKLMETEFKEKLEREKQEDQEEVGSSLGTPFTRPLFASTIRKGKEPATPRRTPARLGL